MRRKYKVGKREGSVSEYSATRLSGNPINLHQFITCYYCKGDGNAFLLNECDTEEGWTRNNCNVQQFTVIYHFRQVGGMGYHC